MRKTDNQEDPSASFTHRRGLWAKALFIVFAVVPCPVLVAASVWFCVNHDRPILIAVGVLVVGFLVVDHFAYDTFCEISITPEGLLYRGGGLLWRRVRKERTFPWSKYVYTLVPWRGFYGNLFITDKDKLEAAPRDRRPYELPALIVDVPFPGYLTYVDFVREIMIRNPDARVEGVPRRPRLKRGTMLVEKGSIQIVGNLQFIERTMQSLELIREHDPVNYRRVQKYLKRIESSERRSVSATEAATGTFEATGAAAFSGDARWYASTIVHEMCHCMLYHRFRFWGMDPKSRKKREEICCRAQLRSLRRMGASRKELQWQETRFRKRLVELFGDANE